MKYPLTILFIIYFSIFVSCHKETQGVINAGKKQTIVRTVDEFYEIVVEQDINLIISPGKAQEVLINCGENLIEGIGINVKNGILTLSNKNLWNRLRNNETNIITVFVSVPELQKLKCYGSGTVSCTDTIKVNDFLFDAGSCTGNVSLLLNTRTFWFQISSGTLNIEVKGKGTSGVINTLSYGFAGFRDFETEVLHLNTNSTNNTFVNVSKELVYKLKNIGNIYYKGNPELTKIDASGAGKLIELNEQ